MSTAMTHDVAASTAKKSGKTFRFSWTQEATAHLLDIWAASGNDQSKDNLLKMAESVSSEFKTTITDNQVRAKLVNLKEWKKAVRVASSTRTKKEPAWTAEKTELLLKLYKESGSDSSVENLTAIGKQILDKAVSPDGKGGKKETSTPKTFNMIRNKLVKEDVYIPLQRAVGGTNSEKKLSITREIESLLGTERDSLISLEKGKKDELQKLRELIQQLKA